ncbi:MAG: heparinase II/III family protein, partial [Bacteroidales bacterium]|nr:heparinase II/III family protein [Bacteroidales bacterium]
VLSTIHPCLLLLKGEEAKINALIASSEQMKTLHKRTMSQAEEAVRAGVSEYRLDESGKRLLNVCRSSLQKLFSLAYAYRRTKSTAYLTAARSELNVVCSFPDWHPSHYLDTAEMAMGVAIAYDWLYDYLSVEMRKLVAGALEKFAIDTALESSHAGVFKESNNWSQVCNGGILFAALALRDVLPVKMNKIYQQYIKGIRNVVNTYDPDGAYAEGAGYWDYGTTYNVLLNYALKQNGYDIYMGNGGFAKTGYYYFHVMGPSHQYFNYADNATGGGFSISPFYFAAINNDPSLLWWEMNTISNKMGANRHMPAALAFAKDMDLSSIPEPSQLTWTGGGKTPVYFTRSAWNDANAAFFGVKGGKASENHAHMDAGTFVYEVNGERWVIDQGPENYAKVEAAGVSLWSMGQTSGRWDLLRYQNQYHNVITLDNKKFKVNGMATITETFDEGMRRGAKLDLTPCYNDVESVGRSIALVDNRKLEIHDELTPTKEVDMVWTLVTDKSTDLSVIDNTTIRMTRDEKSVLVSCKASVPVEGGWWHCKATTDYEAADAKCLGFKASLPAHATTTITVTLNPEQ